MSGLKGEKFSVNLSTKLKIMSLQLTFSDLVKEAVRLDFNEYEKFVTTVNKLRAEQNQGDVEKQESALLAKINKGFPLEKWQQIQLLDAKMEADELSETEFKAYSELVDDYEKYCVLRLKLLKKLALLKNISLEESMNQLGIENGKN